MSKRPHDDASAATENLIKRLKSGGNDDIRLREAVESCAGASAATELAVPLTGATSTLVNASKLKTLPREVLLDILASLRRRDLDALELVNRAMGSFISAKSDDAPSRVISLMFYEEGLVMLTCQSDGWKRLPIIEMPPYLPRSAIRPCGSHFAAGSVCDFRLFYAFPPNILYRALTEVFMCTTFVFAKLDSFFDQRHYGDEHSLPALSCIANCESLQIDEYHEALFDANGALDWLLGTHAAAPGMKHLSVGDVGSGYWDDFLVPFIVAIEQVVVDTDVRKPNGEPALKTRVAIRRKATA